MGTTSSMLIIVGLLFLFLFLAGYRLRLSGKPYSTLVLTIHKLIGVAAGIYLILMVFRVYQAGLLYPIGIIAVAVTVLFFLALVATGGLLSAENSTPLVVSTTHRLLPYLTMISTAATIYLLS